MAQQQFITEITGFPGVRAEVKAWFGRLEKTLQRIVTEYTLLIEAEARRLAPVDTGRLRASIHHELTKTATEIAGAILSGVDYAVHVEWGTIYQSAQPHMRPSYEKFKDAFIRAIEDAVANQK